MALAVLLTAASLSGTVALNRLLPPCSKQAARLIRDLCTRQKTNSNVWELLILYLLCLANFNEVRNTQ
ncbi:hypothetical protein C8N47_11652 [Mangrovibacterium marinum]|uniref:Uncharacterized protein n=1 Tax=Mangrovibacterium marinum TaxID=1639118 RepID=A0A2T5BZ34_9BACT|nr:hypothetical protein C8N47_11652 [Mangrovibacterium marinum]